MGKKQFFLLCFAFAQRFIYLCCNTCDEWIVATPEAIIEYKINKHDEATV